jgi:two-component sensor histidine kinase
MREEWLGHGWLEAVHPDDREEVGRHWRESVSAGRLHDSEVRVRRADGSWCWCRIRAAPVRDGEGRITRWVAMASDIGRRKRAEEERELLLGELNHRVKNLFGVIRSLAAQGDGGPDVEEYKRTFSGRLDALVRAHKLALERDWRSIDLGTLAGRTLEPYATERAEAIAVEGEPVELDPRRALSLSLTLHELATNSVKYGALSAPGGRVNLSWRIVREQGERAELAWNETGGPAVRPPQRRGFGTELVERVFAYDLNGDAELDFRPEGLRVAAWFPLS